MPAFPAVGSTSHRPKTMTPTSQAAQLPATVKTITGTMLATDRRGSSEADEAAQDERPSDPTAAATRVRGERRRLGLDLSTCRSRRPGHGARKGG
jgi:hypothetical protein